MTCELCGKESYHGDVQIREIKGVSTFIACIPCVRLVDDRTRILYRELEEKIKTLIDTQIETIKKLKEKG